MAGARDHLLPGLRSERLAWRAEPAENACRLQFVWELPGCPADSHDLRPDIYVDHRMISTCIRFDSNRVVPYSPTRYPHRSALAVRGSVRASPFLSPPRQGLLEALPPALAANSNSELQD